LTQTNLARFKGKNAVVTGATSGIGNAIVRRLLAEGANVVAAGRRETLLQALEKEYQGSVLGVRTDVMVESDVAQLVQQCVARFGSLQIAFNVAGAATIGTIVDGSSEDWESTIDLCLRSVYWSIKYQAKQFIAQGTGGSIVNVSSLNQVVPFYGASSYATAKAGVGMLTQNAALELARHRIRVNALLPGLTETPATGIISATPDINALYMERIPLGRAARSEEMAAPAVFLASEDASYITGASLIVDGGWATTGYPDSSRWLGKWLPPA
jgi:NAD(P)-dependent dehydrogenase (short-subunit alcohol dehydrogenase family)